MMNRSSNIAPECKPKNTSTSHCAKPTGPGWWIRSQHSSNTMLHRCFYSSWWTSCITKKGRARYIFHHQSNHLKTDIRIQAAAQDTKFLLFEPQALCLATKVLRCLHLQNTGLLTDNQILVDAVNNPGQDSHIPWRLKPLLTDFLQIVESTHLSKQNQ